MLSLRAAGCRCFILSDRVGGVEATATSVANETVFWPFDEVLGDALIASAS